MEREGYKDEIFICKCSSVEHQVVAWYDDDFVYASIHLCRLPFWERLWKGIKYILGYRCKYGHFEEFIWRKEDVEKLEGLVRRLRGEE